MPMRRNSCEMNATALPPDGDRNLGASRVQSGSRIVRLPDCSVEVIVDLLIPGITAGECTENCKCGECGEKPNYYNVEVEHWRSPPKRPGDSSVGSELRAVANMSTKCEL